MCNHFRTDPQSISTWREYIGWDLYDRLPEPDLWPRREALVARRVDGCLALDTMIWGVPLTMQGKRSGTTVTRHVTNVRNLSSPFWRATLTDPGQRCLVPFSAFAERREGSPREEVWFDAAEQRLKAFAGIWRMSDGGPVFAFLTCAPSPVVAEVHPKAMPLVLRPTAFAAWLDGAPPGTVEQAQLIRTS